MTEKTLRVSDEIMFVTEGLDANIYVDGEQYVTLGRDDLGAIAEWLAVAWENVAGEPYEPVVLAEGGYVKQGYRDIPYDRMGLVQDDGNGLERDCE